MSTTTAVPETVTVDLDSAEVSHVSQSIDSVIAEQGGRPETAASDSTARSAQSKLPSEGGQVELSLIEATTVERATFYADAQGNPLALMFGLPEEVKSSALNKLTGALDALVESHGVDSVDEAIKVQAKAAGFTTDDEE